MFTRKSKHNQESQVGDLTIMPKPQASAWGGSANISEASERRFMVDFVVSAILFLSIFLFLWLGCPQYLLYQEQNQLFLFTGSYFTHAISVPGGLADYISEFIVQFDYIPLYGALFSAFVLTLPQVLLGAVCRRSDLSDALYVLAAIPSLLFVAAMGDENTLFSFAVAMMLTTLFIFVYSLRKTSSLIEDSIWIIVGFAILYWIAGPIAIAYPVITGILSRRPLASVIGIAVAFVIIWGIHALWMQQYPLERLIFGINYYRVPEIYPTRYLVIFLVMIAIPFGIFVKTTKKIENFAVLTSVIAMVIFGVLYIPSCFNADKSRVFAYDSLVRQGRWADIIERAKKERPTDSFSLQAQNLALGMTGQLPETMFNYSQNGVEGLIGNYHLDNTSQLVTAETLFRLGLTNVAFLTTFDLQEAIMNDRKSGRHMKRMAECMLVNGNYDVAAKYIGFLRNSLFYKEWAEKAAELLGNDQAVEAHPIYGPLRRKAFTKTGFYDPSQLDKILAIMVNESNGSNRLALDYFYATDMLKGDLNTLAGVCNYNQERLGEQILPRHVQEALAMYWTFSHPSFEGIPFQINPDVQKQTMALAQAVMANKNNPAAWQNAAPGSFGAYFLSKSSRPQSVQTSPQYQPTHE